MAIVANAVHEREPYFVEAAVNTIAGVYVPVEVSAPRSDDPTQLDHTTPASEIEIRNPSGVDARVRMRLQHEAGVTTYLVVKANGGSLRLSGPLLRFYAGSEGGGAARLEVACVALTFR